MSDRAVRHHALVACGVVAVLVAGCILPGPPPEPYIDRAAWQEEGAFETFPDAGRNGDWEIYRHDPRPGLPFNGSAFDEKWPDYNLTEVKLKNWTVSSHEAVTIKLTNKSVVVLKLNRDIGREALGVLFLDFASPLTTSDDAGMAKLREEFIGSRTTSGTKHDLYQYDDYVISYRVELPGPLDLAGHFDGLDRAIGFEPGSSYGGFDRPGVMVAGNWSYTFSLPYKTAAHLDPDVEGFTARVYSSDEVFLTMRSYVDNGTEAWHLMHQYMASLGHFRGPYSAGLALDGPEDRRRGPEPPPGSGFA